MSEFLAEAQVLVVPNVAAFAATLKVQLAKAVAEVGPVIIPVAAAPISGGAGVVAKETAAALQVQGAAATKATAATTALTRAEAAAALAAQKLAFAQTEVAGAAGAVGAAQVTFTRSTAAAVAAASQLNKALVTNDAVLISAARASVVLADAQALEAETALAAARAQALHSASLSQLGRGAGATGLTFLGLRGATLAASAAFLGGAAAVVIASKSIAAASDRTEQLNKSVEVFAQSAPQVQAWAETTATSLGISETAALSASATYGELFRTLGVGPQKAAVLSQSLVDLAADLASFNNVSTDRALQAIQSGLVGQARPLRALGVFLTAARVEEEALVETGKKFTSQLTQQDKILARNSLIFKDAAIQIGDVDRTSGRLANQSRFLGAQLNDLAAGIGSKLTPALTDVVITANAALTGLNKLGHAKPVPSGPDVTNLLGWVGGWKELGFVWDHSIFPGLFKMDEEVTVLDGIIKNVTLSLNSLKAGFAKLGDATATPSVGQSLDLQLSLAQSSGNQAQELALLQQKAAKQDAFLQSLLGKEQTSKRVALEKKASDNLTKTNTQIQRILDERTSDAEQAANDQKQAREKAAQAQADDTQAFIDSFTGKQGRLANKLTSAELAGNFKRQIAINKAIKTANKAEIAALQERINQLHLHGDALKTAKDTIASLIQANFNTSNAIDQLKAERRQTIADSRETHLEALLSIAETTKSTRDDVAVQKALIAFDKVQINRILAIKRKGKLTRDEAAQLDAYRVDLAQRNAALKETTEEEKKGRNQFAQLSFEFLQMQQGFTSKLLSNLIPGSATAGLVGGGSTAAQAAIRPPGMGVTQESHIAQGKDVGFSAGQGNTTNAILRKILHNLEVLNGHSSHPEARNQRVMHSGSAHYLAE